MSAVHRVVVGFLVTAVAAAAIVVSSRSTASAKPAAFCPAQSATFTDANPFVGVMDAFADFETPAQRNCTFGQMAADHIGYFRETLSWAAVQPLPGVYDFSRYDAVIADLATHHIRMLPMLLGAPNWASPRPSVNVIYPPRSFSQFAAFAALCVQRYGPGGAFWRLNPQLPYFPVRAWEIWNEPNLAQYWAPKPDLAAYVRLLKASSTAIKRVDRHATIVVAGMPFFNGPAESDYLTRLYRNGARGSFDALGLHTYSVTVSGALQRLQTARAVMNRFGDRRKGIWLTEWGWAGGPPNPFIVSAKGQKANVVGFLALIQRYRRSLGLSETMYVDWRDGPVSPGPKNFWANHLGLVTADLHPKPALSPFVQAARTLSR